MPHWWILVRAPSRLEPTRLAVGQCSNQLSHLARLLRVLNSVYLCTCLIAQAVGLSSKSASAQKSNKQETVVAQNLIDL